MPTYDYRCNACGHCFEKFQGITDPAVRKCPVCRKLAVKRLIGTGAAVIFKGSGFYQTDYRSSEYKRRAGEESSSKPAAGSSTDKGPSTDSSTSTDSGKSTGSGSKADSAKTAPKDS